MFYFLFFIDLDKEVEELKKENELVNQMIDQVTKFSEEENKGNASHLHTSELR